MKSGKKVVAFIGVGSNIGNRKRFIKKALRVLEKERDIEVKTISSCYETEPLGFTDQRKFLNLVVKVFTTFKPDEFLKKLKAIEKDVGRKRTFRWGPREIDLDILLYGNEIICKKDLVIPHPELSKRQFVLVPLCEIASEVIVPGFNKTAKKLLAECDVGKE